MPPKYERPKGILTEKDRLYLHREEEPTSKQARYSRKTGIRQRVKNGILDFQHLRWIEKKERQRIFNEIHENNLLYSSLEHMIAFARFGSHDTSLDFEELVAGGVRLSTHEPRVPAIDDDVRYAAPLRLLDHVDVDIETHFNEIPRPTTLRAKLEDGIELNRQELGHLIQSDEMDKRGWEQLQDQYGAIK